MKWGQFFLAACAAAITTGSAIAAPAVSNTNVKFTGLLGESEVLGSSDTSWSAIAALTAPLGEKWGLQVEAGASGFDDNNGFGGAAHVFRRDPDKYLAGVFISHASIEDADITATRLGVEGELYFEKISILAAAGYQTSDDLGDSAFGGIELRVYATDDFVLSAGGSVLEDTSYGRIGAEWRIAPGSLPGVALRAEAALGEDDMSSVMGGLTVYLGEDASLKDRHRSQDPDSALFNQFQGLQAHGGAAGPQPVIQCIVQCVPLD